MNRIQKVIDKYFDFMDEIEGNTFIDELIPESMIDTTKKPKFENTLFWTAIKSTVENNEISQLEEFYKHGLPISYKSFLKYRHFIELQLGSSSIFFFKNLPKTLVNDTKEEIQSYYWSLIERNYLPIAALDDFGVICFDANKPKENHDYPVVSFDHEDNYQTPEEYAINFESMFEEFEQHLEVRIERRRMKESL